jgi:hypothetical protein
VLYATAESLDASSAATLFLLPGGRPRRLGTVASFIQAGGLPRRGGRPPAPHGQALQGGDGLFEMFLLLLQLFENFGDIDHASPPGWLA